MATSEAAIEAQYSVGTLADTADAKKWTGILACDPLGRGRKNEKDVAVIQGLWTKQIRARPSRRMNETYPSPEQDRYA